MPLPSYEQTLQSLSYRIFPQVGQKLTDMYFSYVIWNRDSNILNQEKIRMQTWLTHIVELENTNINWIVSLINQTSGLSPLTLEDFWGGSLTASVENRVEPAFTLPGKEAIQSFIREMENALKDPLSIANKKVTFQAWYRKEYFDAWRTFSSSFHYGSERLKGATEWLQTATKMKTDQNPYFLLIDRIAKEMKPYSENSDLPTWLQCVYVYKKTDKIPVMSKKNRDKSGSLIKKAAKTLGSTVAKIEKQTGQKPTDEESGIVSAEALSDYKDALSNISSSISSQDTAFKMATAIYSEDPAASQTPYFEARQAFEQLRVTMVGSRPDQEQFWELARGPLDFLLVFISREAACQLQKIWQDDVLMSVQSDADISTLIQDLLDKDGYARKFIMGPANPFISNNFKKGYFAKIVDGQSIPFDSFFFTFLNKGSQSVKPSLDSYTVTIHWNTPNANEEALVKPETTELEIECSDKTYRLENLGFPDQKKVTWSMQTCGRVTLRIKMPDILLSKRYSGNRAFPEFLKDFEDGSRTFYPNDFPEEQGMLKANKVHSIIVRYHFEGHRPVIQLLQSGPERVPGDIVECWDN